VGRAGRILGRNAGMADVARQARCVDTGTRRRLDMHRSGSSGCILACGGGCIRGCIRRRRLSCRGRVANACILSCGTASISNTPYSRLQRGIPVVCRLEVVLIWTIAASWAVSLEEGLACGPVGIKTESILALEEVAKAEVPLCVLRRIQDLGSYQWRSLHLRRHVRNSASRMGRLHRVIVWGSRRKGFATKGDRRPGLLSGAVNDSLDIETRAVYAIARAG